MSYELRAVVSEADPALTAAVQALQPMASVSRSGALFVPLQANRELSHAIYEDEWRDEGEGAHFFSFSPNQAAEVVHTIFELPEVLVDSDYSLSLENMEASDRSYAQVVAGHSGERLSPYRREGRSSRFIDVGHATTSVFSAPKMSQVRFDQYRAQSGKLVARLTFSRASVKTVDGLITMTEDFDVDAKNEALLILKERGIAGAKPELGQWEGPLQAMFDRIGCKLQYCDGHYDADPR